MPVIKSFEIRNFKGVKSVKISLQEKVSNPVVTLIGLNESGKTTILEALSHFLSSDNLVSSLFKNETAKLKYTDIIPIDKRSAFSDVIEIEADVQLSKDDIEHIRKLARSMGLEVDEGRLATSFSVTKGMEFIESVHKSHINLWDLDLWVREIGEQTYVESWPEDKDDNPWNYIINSLQERLPRVAYFPTFLVDIPNKIYLKAHSNETAVNRHYRSIIQSILEGVDGGLDLDKHVCDRISNYAAGNGKINWQSDFFISNEKSIVDSVFHKISYSVTKVVIGGWRRVFSKDSTAKQITIEWHIDGDNMNMPYASFMVSDGASKYDISERSLGFRWFFSFLLFTGFKSEKSKATILVFDEPAANLHAKAQAELLKSFEKIAIAGTKIIYSTHSHHMINPKWLGGAYIVENTALNVDADDEFEFSSNPTNIKATKYREFLSSYPSRSSYFQPVIERLDYVTPEIVSNPPYVLVEGISDYYALVLAQKVSGLDFGFRLVPGVGSGASGPLISLMMGRGEKFVVLLDDDTAGTKECVRYKNEWHLGDCTVITLASLDKAFAGKALEKLFDEAALDIIKSHYGMSGKVSKKQIGWYLSEACAVAQPGAMLLSSATLDSFVLVLKKLDQLISGDS